MVTADFLAEQGKEVVLLNRGAHFAAEMSANDRYYLRERLKRSSVTLYKKVAIRSFTPHGVTFKHPGGEEDLAGFDTVVVAGSGEPVRDILPLLRAMRRPFQTIGDAKSPRHLMFAISEAEETARAL